MSKRQVPARLRNEEFKCAFATGRIESLQNRLKVYWSLVSKQEYIVRSRPGQQPAAEIEVIRKPLVEEKTLLQSQPEEWLDRFPLRPFDIEVLVHPKLPNIVIITIERLKYGNRSCCTENIN